MTDGEFMKALRNKLTPFNPHHDIIKMGILSNYGYMDGDTVRKAIDCLESRLLASNALGDKLNPLEALGAILLLESANLRGNTK